MAYNFFENLMLKHSREIREVSSELAEKASQASLDTQKNRIDNLVQTASTSYYEKCASTDTGALLIVSSGATTGQINLASVTPVTTGYTATAGDYVRLVYGLSNGNTELVDSRVGADGITYDSVGNAIREQITSLSKYTEINLGTLQHGYYVSDTGALVSFSTEDAYYSASDYIDCENLNTILSNCCYDSSAGLAFYDKNKVFISWSASVSRGADQYITVPQNAKYFRVSQFTQTSVFTTKQKISVPYINNTVSVNSTLKNYLTGYDVKATGVSGFYANQGDKLVINVKSNTIITNLYINVYQGESYFIIPTGSGIYEFVAPKSGYVELQDTGTSIDMSITKGISQDTNVNSVYVSPSGDDNNPGTYASPLKTVAKALSVSDNVFIFSGTYLIADDSLNASDRKISIKGLQGNNVNFKFGQSISVTKNSSTGYYESEAYTFDSSTYRNYVLYIDGVPDASTLIDMLEIHPRQTGHKYRLESTQLKMCSTLTELDGKTSGFYYDGSKFIIKTSLTISSVWLPSLKFIDFTRCDCEITNINILYSSLIIRLGICKMADCRILFPTSDIVGGLAYLTANIELIRCEVCGMNDSNSLNSETTGDGVCGILQHTDYLRNELSATLIDCWIHDNQDDGFSDHGQGCNTIIGGLFEHNRKAGIIPASGINSTVIGATSRGQQYGYAITNGMLNGNDDDLYMGIELVDCLASGNSIANYVCLNDISSVICRNCQSEDSAIGYSISSTSSSMTLHNCTSLNDVTVKSGTVTAKNGNAVV